MKRIFLSALIGVGMVALIFQILSGSEAARTPESYPLVCRGGPSVGRGSVSVSGKGNNIAFYFTRGTKPAREGLAPGECSWVDRGMHADEPDMLSQHVEEDTVFSEIMKIGRTPLSPKSTWLPPENRWYEELLSSDKYWTFQVYNNGLGQLIATEARPNLKRDFPVSVTARVPSDIGVIERPRSYPLLCRGSESLEIAFTPSIRAIGFTFTRGTKPAGEGLAPGECSWVDRGMRADESDELSQHVEDNWESLDKGEAGRLLPPETRWYEELRSSRKSWRFMVYRQRSVLWVTSARSQG